MKRMFKIIFPAVVFILLLLLLLVDCKGISNKNKIIGTWQGVYKNNVLTYTFDEKGSFNAAHVLMNTVVEDGKVVSETEMDRDTACGSYYFNGDKLCMEGDAYDFVSIGTVFLGDYIILLWGEQTLNRQSRDDMYSEGIYGQWYEPKTERKWYVYTDGTIKVSEEDSVIEFTEKDGIYVTNFIGDEYNFAPLSFVYEKGKIKLYYGFLLERVD